MNKKLLNVFASLIFAASMSSVAIAADETVGEKTSEMVDDTGKAVKKGARKVKDKTCRMVKGKMECAAEKVKHKVENVTDEAKDKVEDVK